jgi:hypothetical protein
MFFRELAEEASGGLREDRDAIARVAEYFAGCIAAEKGSIGNSVYIPVTLAGLAKKILMPDVYKKLSVQIVGGTLSMAEAYVKNRIKDVSVLTRKNYKIEDFATDYGY